MEALGLVLGHDVSNHDGQPLDTGFAIAQGLEEAHAGFGHQREQLRIVQMPALVDMADIDLDFGGKRELLWQLELDAGHRN